MSTMRTPKTDWFMLLLVAAFAAILAGQVAMLVLLVQTFGPTW